MSESPKVIEAVKDYYGAPPVHIREIIKLLDPEVENTYYGCGLVIPQVLDGLRILDLGSGTGRDCFILSKLVGQHGHVVGVDMTDEQLAKANAKIEFHTKAFGYARPNVEFKKGYIEKLGELGLAENSFDLIVSNCVINLSPDKRAVLDGAYRLLKPGGELYFSDVYADRRMPRHLMEDPVLWGECISGALYGNDFLHLARYLLALMAMSLSGPIAAKLEPVRFYSAEYRLFKVMGLDHDCEDYGQAVSYRGTIPTHPLTFPLDAHHCFATGKVMPVCRNTYLMLKESRHAPHFNFYGEGTTHFGLFEGCGSKMDIFAAVPPAARTPEPVVAATPKPAAAPRCC